MTDPSISTENESDEQLRQPSKEPPLTVSAPIVEEERNTGEAEDLAKLYENRLREFWSIAHRTAASERPGEIEIFLESMTRLADLGALVNPSDASAEEILGTIDDVNLVVRRRMSAELAPRKIAEFIRLSLAPTIARFERLGEGTPEVRTDVIYSAATKLPMNPAVGRLGCELMRYLRTQPSELRGVGYYDTLDNIAILVRTGGEDYTPHAVLISHLVIAGLLELRLANHDLTRSALPIMSNSAFRLATMLSALPISQQIANSPAAARVFRDLQLISAVTTPRMEISPESAAEFVRLLGFSTDRPVDFLTALDDMGSVGMAWQRSGPGRARLIAMSGITRVLSGRPGIAGSRMFNAGVTLFAYGQEQPILTEPLMRTRLLVNTVGLRLALLVTDSLYTALTTNSGLSCAVNLLASFIQYRTVQDPIDDVLQQYRPLLQDLVNLTNLPGLQRTGVDPDLARLEASGNSLQLRPEPSPNLETLPQHVEDALDAIRASLSEVPRLIDPVTDCANLLRQVFSSLLEPTEEEDLQQLVQEVIDGREHPLRVLEHRYADYSAGDGTDFGLGPLVRAGILDQVVWKQLNAQLLEPRATIVPALKAFDLA